MNKPSILLESDLFTEDELQDTKKIISKYFNIINTSLNIALVHNHNKLFSPNTPLRGSLNVAKFIGHKFEYAHATKWIPYYRKYLVDPSMRFTDFNHLTEFSKDAIPEMFIRPVDPFKSFAGQVFKSKEKLIEEFNFCTKNKNIDPYILCAYGKNIDIEKEFRCIYINGRYVNGSQYLKKGLIELDTNVPEEIIDFSHRIARQDYFLNIPNFVIDIGIVYGNMRLIEINAFETASFYAADLDKIYSTWANYLQI